ncbi:hypothetical protein FQN54_004740 [Arachnomyces sp. PD_36]|nr:hypothetical protein FQN54_004740 [Arachnomyces sp. PD_36]
MSDVRSKNLYELLGNDPEQDSDREPEPPTKAIDKPSARFGKRDAPKTAPEPTTTRGGAGAGRGGGRRGGFSGNEEAFRDRGAGAHNNRRKPTDETYSGGRGRGGRGRDDRHSRTGQTDTTKQVEQGWGGASGEAELKDEILGEAIAKKDENEPEGEEKEPEVEDKSISYADYLAEQAAKKAAGLGVKEARKPNEGSKPDKKWSQAKEIKHDGEDEEYIPGKEEKARRERQRKEKNFLDVDMRFVEAPSRGRGDGRGRGRGGDRGRGGRGRGDGFRGRGDGAPRGGRGQAPTSMDEKNFPSLGAK